MVGVAWFYSKVKGVFEKTPFFLISHANLYALGRFNNPMLVLGWVFFTLNCPEVWGILNLNAL